MSGDAYQIRSLWKEANPEHPGPWTRDSMRAALGLAQNVVRRSGLVGIFAGPGYREQIRVVFSKESGGVMWRLAFSQPPALGQPEGDVEVLAQFVRLGWARPDGDSWKITKAGIGVAS